MQRIDNHRMRCKLGAKGVNNIAKIQCFSYFANGQEPKYSYVTSMKLSSLKVNEKVNALKIADWSCVGSRVDIVKVAAHATIDNRLKF